MKTFMAAAIAAVMAAGCAGPSENEISTANAATKLSGAEAHALLAGNSLTGRSKTGKSDWTEYYDSSGKIMGRWKSVNNGDSGDYAGTWKTDGDKTCFDYDGTEFDGCSVIAVSGDLVYGFNEDGTPSNADRPSTYIKGNALGT
jgi:hypothetical protein